MELEKKSGMIDGVGAGMIDGVGAGIILYFYKQFTQAPNKIYLKHFKQKICQ